jgi:glycolate oxidase FAD binding subunit
VPAIGGQAGSGVLYVQWRLPEAGPNGRLAATATTLAAIRSTCGQLGGSLVIEAAPRALKEQLDVWGDVGPSLRLMQRLKAALDPNATLNPGRFVGGI